jgi:5'-3' exonuclease
MLYLVDASVYVFRAYFSIPASMTDPHGRPVNALYGFARFLVELLEEARPELISVAFDESLTTSFRNEIYPAYKANRELPPAELEAQFQRCRVLTRALGLLELASPVYEADDIIATLATRGREAGTPVVVVTRDKDLAQLLRPGDEFWDFAARRRIPYEEIAAKFGVRPERMADYLALTGDAVDNIPGVPGIGPKTAAALLDAFADLEALYADLETVTELPIRGAARVRERLDEHRDTAFLARRLTRLHDAVPLDIDEGALTCGAPDLTALAQVFEESGFGPGLRRRIERLAGG